MNRVTIQTSDDVIDLLVVPVYTELAGACVLYYDYLLTLRSEVQFVWKKRTGLSTAFYFIIRYGSILVSALTLVHIVPPPFPGPGLHLTESSCRGLISLSVVLNACIFAAISAFVAIRMFAMWSRNWYIGSILFLMGLVNPSSITVLNALAYRAVPGPPSLVACVSYLSKSSISLYPVMIEYFPLISSAVSIVYELTCLVLTAFKTFSLWQDQRRTGMSTRFTSMLLRDGSLYFAVMSTLSLLNIISVLIPPHLIPADVQVNAVYSRVLTPILTTRFIVHLKSLDGPDTSYYYSSTRSDSSAPTLRFGRGTGRHSLEADEIMSRPLLYE